ncbi:MAG: tRNA adenosine(34) deaminase TadA [Pseudomonadales bacterium]|nr:tRNA adenosine(34) deaminase TadA [Pseudomonadales bacterium]
MRKALELARTAQGYGEVPVGAVVVLDNQLLGEGCNGPIGRTDPTAHAEMLALRQAARALKNYRMPDATLYVTVEPCTMCAGALIHARIKTLVFAATEPRAGAIVSSAQVLDNPKLNHKVQVLHGLMAEESSVLLRSFFASKRAKRSRKV